MKSINDDKASGCDGLNAGFFKKTCQIIGDQVTDAILCFFKKAGEIYKAINCATVTLMPKVKNPSTIKEYRPVSCCTILYKIISKILINRLKGVMELLVDVN